MPLPASSLSVICKSVADFVSDGLDASTNSLHVLVGNPVDAVPSSKDSDDHNLNLFFHRFEPAGFGPGTPPDEPWQIRIHCLITAFSTTTPGGDGEEGTKVSAGENDLRLIGEVVRLFHEHPVLPAMDVDGETVRLQVVFRPLVLEEINHLWSTQGDVSYRPSVAYEMALTPIIPATRATGAGLVGSLGVEVRGTPEALYDPFQGAAAPPPVEAFTVEVRRRDWAPRIRFVYEGVCLQSLAFALDDPDLATLTPRVWIAGDPSEKVSLRWDVWHRDTGWDTQDASPAEASPQGTAIDPENPPLNAELVELKLPSSSESGQAVLYAIHDYRVPGEDADRPMRSNPLMLTLYGTGE